MPSSSDISTDVVDSRRGSKSEMHFLLKSGKNKVEACLLCKSILPSEKNTNSARQQIFKVFAGVSIYMVYFADQR